MSSFMPGAINSETFQIGAYSVVVKKRLAEGGFGFVDLVSEHRSGKDLCLKRCDVQREESLATVKKEISILETFAGPYVVRLIGADITTTKTNHKQALILLEFCPGGHLLDRLLARNGSYLPTEVLYKVFGQLLTAVHSLHTSHPITVHRDLKLENVLFGDDGCVRLCDFGSCEMGIVPLTNSEQRAQAEEKIAKETTQMYRAPEMIDLYLRNELTEKTDIWALGCIFYAICYLTHPFQDCGPLGILNGKIPPRPLDCTDQIPQNCDVLIERMLDLDPEARPTTEELLTAFAALARNQPLPHWELTEKALQCRRDREQAAINRENKQNKKTFKYGTNVPPKPVVSGSVLSSAAARRLAAKKGEEYVEPQTAQSSSLFDVIPTTAAASTSSNTDSFVADFGHQSLHAAPVAVGTADGFGLFEGDADPCTNTPAVTSAPAAAFDGFGDAPAVATAPAAAFDGFGDAPAVATAPAAAFDAFGGTVAPANNYHLTADSLFGDSPMPASTSQVSGLVSPPTPPAKRNSLMGVFDTVSSFEGMDTGVSAAGEQSVDDFFGVSTTAGTNFDNFGASSNTGNASTTDNVFGLFDNAPPAVAAAPAAPVDIFGCDVLEATSSGSVPSASTGNKAANPTVDVLSLFDQPVAPTNKFEALDSLAASNLNNVYGHQGRRTSFGRGNPAPVSGANNSLGLSINKPVPNKTDKHTSSNVLGGNDPFSGLKVL